MGMCLLGFPIGFSDKNRRGKRYMRGENCILAT